MATDIIFSHGSFFTLNGVKISPIDSSSFSNTLSGYGKTMYPFIKVVVLMYGTVYWKKSVGGFPIVRVPIGYKGNQTVYAWLATDPSYQEPIVVNSVKLNKTNLNLVVGTSEKLLASISPDNWY